MSNSFTYKEAVELLSQHNLLKFSDNKYEDTVFSGISYNSSNTRPGDMFVCKSLDFNKVYLISAIGNGALCYLAECDFEISDSDTENSFPFILTTNVRKALALLSAHFYDYPAKKLKMIGITGTKGKTTTTYILKSILNPSYNQDEEDDFKNATSGILSTVEIFTGRESRVAHLTTPESLELHSYLRESVDNGLKYMTMEVTSQSYKMSRVYGIDYDVAIFLNIGEDHIGPGEHNSMEEYLTCKEELLQNSSLVILNKHTDSFDRLYNVAKNSDKCEKIIVFGMDGESDVILTNIEKLPCSGFKFQISYEDENSIKHSHSYKTNLNGRFNLENILAAFCVARHLGIKEEDIERGLANISIAGRMNLYEKNGIVVIVDFAHNHMSFKTLYNSIQADYPGRNIKTVFGCPGNKAYNRRKDLSLLTAEYASYAYVTADDPGFESPMDICDILSNYLNDKSFPHEIIIDRTRAIEKALKDAKAGDVIVIAGKGEEEYQKIAGEFIPYESDVKVVKRVLGL